MKEMKGASPYIQKHVFLREKNNVCSDWSLGFLKVSTMMKLGGYMGSVMTATVRTEAT